MKDKKKEIRCLKILLVDDDAPFLKYCQRILERENISTTAETDPVKALELYIEAMQSGAGRFDVVVTDLNMPLLRGDQLAKQLKARDEAALVILMSASDLSLTEEQVMQCGACCFLEKNLEMTGLVALLKRMADEIKESRPPGPFAEN